jgi:hypothetical protein
VDGAIAYCRQHGGQEGWLALLDMFLRPGGWAPPGLGTGRKARAPPSAGCVLLPCRGLRLLAAVGAGPGASAQRSAASVAVCAQQALSAHLASIAAAQATGGSRTTRRRAGCSTQRALR